MSVSATIIINYGFNGISTVRLNDEDKSFDSPEEALAMLDRLADRVRSMLGADILIWNMEQVDYEAGKE